MQDQQLVSSSYPILSGAQLNRELVKPWSCLWESVTQKRDHLWLQAALIDHLEQPDPCFRIDSNQHHRPWRVGCRIHPPVEMVTRGLHTGSDECGMLVYGYKFRPVTAKASEINTKIYRHYDFRGKCLLSSSKFPLILLVKVLSDRICPSEICYYWCFG